MRLFKIMIDVIVLVMKKFAKKIIVFLLVLAMLEPYYAVNIYAKVERHFSDEFGDFRERKRFGVLATNVQDVKTGINHGFRQTSIFVSQKKGRYRIIDFSKKRDKKYSIRYKNALIGTNMTDFVPISASRGIYRNETGTIKENGEGMKEPLVPSKDRNKIEKYWGNNWMLAYVSDNVLKIIYSDEGKVRKYFQGETGKIKKVVAGNFHSPRSVFVLMEDGSVWGMGNNEYHLISDASKKKYTKFQKIVSGGVMDISATWVNVAVLKEDKSLWVWGKYRSGKKKCSVVPQKIDDNVKNFDLSYNNGYDPVPILAYVNESGEAYGWGSNDDWSMSDSYKSGWLGKPVKLKDNISRVFLAEQMMLLLGKNKTLYWSGNIWEGTGTSVFPVKSKKKK